MYDHKLLGTAITDPMSSVTTAKNAPIHRYAGPSNWLKDSTTDFCVYLPTPYSIRMMGMDHNHRNMNHTIRNTSAPGFVVKQR